MTYSDLVILNAQWPRQNIVLKIKRSVITIGIILFICADYNEPKLKQKL